MAEKTIRVEVVARPERGFLRAGMKFTRDPQVVEVDEKTLKILEDEPNLVVRPAPEEKKEDDGRKDGDNKTMSKDLSADEAIAKIKAADSLDELKGISLKGDERVTVNEAHKARQAELKKGGTQGG